MHANDCCTLQVTNAAAAAVGDSVNDAGDDD